MDVYFSHLNHYDCLAVIKFGVFHRNFTIIKIEQFLHGVYFYDTLWSLIVMPKSSTILAFEKNELYREAADKLSIFYDIMQ